jgi:hypothetical protein
MLMLLPVTPRYVTGSVLLQLLVMMMMMAVTTHMVVVINAAVSEMYQIVKALWLLVLQDP